MEPVHFRPDGPVGLTDPLEVDILSKAGRRLGAPLT
jgi:hypothetical protein